MSFVWLLTELCCCADCCLEQFTDLTMDRVLPPLNWDWLTSLIETMEEADWEGLEVRSMMNFQQRY